MGIILPDIKEQSERNLRVLYEYGKVDFSIFICTIALGESIGLNVNFPAVKKGDLNYL